MSEMIALVKASLLVLNFIGLGFAVSLNAQVGGIRPDPAAAAQRTADYNRAIEATAPRAALPASSGMYQNENRLPDASFRKAVLGTQTSFTAKAILIVDGNTFIVKVNDHARLFRLIGVDAPESGQPKYLESIDSLTSQILGKEITVLHSTYGGTDTDGVSLATILIGDRDIGLHLLETGLAWYDDAYEFYLSKPDAAIYKKAHKDARDKKIGIWSESKAEKPWEFRDRKRREMMKTKGPAKH